MQDFNTLLINRRSYRNYADGPLAGEAVQLILEAALLSPTSKNKHSWEFVVVEDREMLAKLWFSEIRLKPMPGLKMPPLLQSICSYRPKSLKLAVAGFRSETVNFLKRSLPENTSTRYSVFRCRWKCSVSSLSEIKKNPALPITSINCCGKKFTWENTNVKYVYNL